MTGSVKRFVQGLDRFQQRHRWLGFAYATAKKFGEDQAGNLAALVAYYGFFSLFPLLLVFVSILGRVLAGHPLLQHRAVNSALANFPVIGSDLKRNVHALSAGSTLALVLGILVALWAGLQVVKAMENALDTVWNVPYRHRPGFVVSNARALVMLTILGAIVLVSGSLSGVGVGNGASWWIAGGVVSLTLNCVLFMLTFRVLTAAKVSWRDVLPGRLLGGVLWTILQALGGYYVGHVVKGATGTYGTFAVVIGLLAWIYLGAQIVLYSAELNVVKVNQLWPRSILREPPTTADQRVLMRLARVEERRAGQKVRTSLPEEGAPDSREGQSEEVTRKVG